MKIPKKVRIKSDVAYNVIEKIMGDDYKGHKILGECLYKSKEIFINLDQSETEKIKTLIHEVIHCIEFEYKMEINHKSVVTLEVALYRILKLNKLI